MNLLKNNYLCTLNIIRLVYKIIIMRKLIIALICIFVVVSCGKDKFDYSGKGEVLLQGEGAVELLLSTSDGMSVKSDAAVKASALDVNDFAVDIYNSNNVVIKHWDKFSQIAAPIKLNAGNYKLKAYYGDSTATGFNIVYFAGVSKFTVEGQQSKTISTVCKQANVQMKLLWGENLVEDYTDYTVKVYREGFKDSLTFVKTETKEGFIPAGTLKFRIYLTDKSGKKRTYASSKMDMVATPNDFITLTVNTGAEQPLDVNLSFKIDTGTDDKVVNVDIPGIMLSKEKPVLTSEDITVSGTELSFYDGVGHRAWVNVKADGYIKKCVLKTTSTYLSSIGWPAEVDIANISSSYAQLLKQQGMSWADNIKDSRISFVDFTEFTKNVKYLAGSQVNTFTLHVTDSYGQEGEYTFSVKPLWANITIASLPDYDVWSTYAYVKVTTNVTDNALWQLEADNGNGWNKVVSAILTTDGNTRTVKATALTPGTAYKFRANYIPREEIVTAEVTGTTEGAVALANGGMESWSSTKLHGGNGTFDTQIDCVFPGEGWSTRNEKTTKGAEGANGTGNYGVYWRWCSGSVSSTDKTEGTSAAEISTLAFYNKGVSLTWKRPSVYSYTKDNGTAYEGYLFTGTFDKNTDSYTLGIEHNSRPESVSFDYKYVPCAGGDRCLAYAKLYDADGNLIAETGDFNSTGQQDYTNKILPFKYTNTGVKATRLVVFFQSGFDKNINNMHQVEGDYNSSPWVHDRIVGSVLKVDNVVLHY